MVELERMTNDSLFLQTSNPLLLHSSVEFDAHTTHKSTIRSSVSNGATPSSTASSNVPLLWLFNLKAASFISNPLDKDAVHHSKDESTGQPVASATATATAQSKHTWGFTRGKPSGAPDPTSSNTILKRNFDKRRVGDETERNDEEQSKEKKLLSNKLNKSFIRSLVFW